MNVVLDGPTFKFACISRPRRFGKSIAEDMLAAYYSKGADPKKLFSRNEYSLQSAICLAYIYALNGYVIAKELATGKGFVDIAYIPFDRSQPALIIELKHNKSAETALTQIREKRYFDSLRNWHGGILFVGVNYDEETKAHGCRIERFVKG